MNSDELSQMASGLRFHAIRLLRTYWETNDSDWPPEEGVRLLTEADLSFRNADHLESLAASPYPPVEEES